MAKPEWQSQNTETTPRAINGIEQEKVIGSYSVADQRFRTDDVFVNEKQILILKGRIDREANTVPWNELTPTKFYLSQYHNATFAGTSDFYEVLVFDEDLTDEELIEINY